MQPSVLQRQHTFNYSVDSYMRTLNASLLAFAITLLLSGCGGKSAAPDAPTTAADDSSKSADKTEVALGPDGKPKKEETAIPIEIAVAARQNISESWQGTANLEPEGEAQVVTKTSGVVLKINVEEGDVVRKGQVLAQLDSDRQRLSLLQSRATLAKMKNDYGRQQQLFERKLIGSEAFERAKFDLETQVAMSQMNELELSYTEIRAPISGVISKRFVKEGNLLTLNQAVFKIDDFDPLQAVLSVPEREMVRIAAGQSVQMLVDAVPGTVFSGTVARVAPTVEAGSGTFRVTAEFRDATGKLRSGMFGRINLVYQSRDNVLTVPRTALLGEDQSTASVFVVDGDKAKRQAVKLGYIGAGVAEIVEGISDGAQVVTLGQAALRDGTKVQVLNAPVTAVVQASSADGDKTPPPATPDSAPLADAGQ
jgi:membrane fusion protein (multidrug efflux system)